MKDLLYGVKAVQLVEVDAYTMLPKAGGAIVNIDTCESVEMEAQISEGEEKIARDDTKILAVAKTDDLLYGYSLKFKDNTFDPEIATMIEGGVVTKVNGEVTAFRSPLLSEGASMRPFRMYLYVASMDGSTIKHYVKLLLPNCTGKSPTFSASKEFYAPEWAITAREATKINLPLKSGVYVEGLPTELATTPTTDTFDKKTGTADNIDLPILVTGATAHTIPTIEEVWNSTAGTVLTATTNYTVSTNTVTIKKTYLSTLAVGDYTFAIVTNYGIIKIDIEVMETP